ncbi:MAG: glycosyltransferase family 2 protein [Holosporales bacterium]|jgi:glycosyltransferase domain-containing protein|nr:glycosyltransferase family 2 protein [Holosporales bacterium]
MKHKEKVEGVSPSEWKKALLNQKRKKERPLVTIAVPTYNRPHFLPRALECIAEQTYKPLEVMVVDNATPGTENEEIVNSFKKKIPGITYSKNPENVGYERNYLHCLEIAKGEFFMHFPDDDEILPAHVEACVETLLEHPEASFSSVYVHCLSSPDICAGITPPVTYMEEDWYKRALAFLLEYFRDEYWGGRMTMHYCVHRRVPFLRAIKSSMEKFYRSDRFFDSSFFFLEMMIEGKVVPVMRKDCALLFHAYTEKLWYEKQELSGFLDNQIEKIRWMRLWMHSYWTYTRRVYMRGGLRYAIPFGVVAVSILGHMFVVSLYRQIKLRLEKMFGLTLAKNGG